VQSFYFRHQTDTLHVADMGDDMVAQQLGIAFESLGADVAFRSIALPALDKIGNRHFRCVDVLALGVFCDQAGKLDFGVALRAPEGVVTNAALASERISSEVEFKSP
jgi:hypothetical protein